MLLFFLRHIKTCYNENGILSGSAETSVLPGQEIKSNISLPVFDDVFCSPLTRCRKTIELIPGRCMNNIRYLDCLTERNLGALEGMEKKKAILTYPELFINNKLDINKTIPGGESLDDIRQRLTRELLPLLTKLPDERCVLICSHNQTLKVLYSMLYGINIDNEFWHKFNFENGTLTKIKAVEVK